MKRLSFFLLLTGCLLSGCLLTVSAQISKGSSPGGGSSSGSSEKPKVRPKAEKDTIPWHGQYLGLDVVPLVKAAFSPNWGVHVQYTCNIYNRFLPVAEFGYARLEASRDLAEHYAAQFAEPVPMQYQGDGVYGKIGVQVPITRKGPDANNLFFAGISYAGASYSYRLLSAPFLKGYWSEPYFQNFPKEHSLAHWLELSAGLRVEISDAVSMGWSLYFKRLFNAAETSHSIPSCVPGYGATDEWVADFSFMVYWHMPW